MVRIASDTEHLGRPLVVVRKLCSPIHSELRPCRIGEEALSRPQEDGRVDQTPSTHADSAHNSHVLEHMLDEEASKAELWEPDEITKTFVRGSHVIRRDTSPLLDDHDSVALFRKAERGHAASEAASNDDDVVVGVQVTRSALRSLP